MIFNDEYFMRIALKEAEKAYEAQEVPIGCVVVHESKIIARAYNQVETLQDPTAHAEMLAITSACHQIGAKYLSQMSIYITVEPCVMCAGAILLSQLSKIVIGCKDNRRGYSQFIDASKSPFHPKAQVVFPVLEAECSDLMKQFFFNKRS